MPQKKHIQPGEKVPLKLTAAQRKLIREDLLLMDSRYEKIIAGTPTGKPVMMTLDDLEDFGGFIAAEANHSDDPKKQKKLDTIFQKVQQLLGTYTDEESPQTISSEAAHRAEAIANQSAQIATWAAEALIAAEQLRIKTKPLENFWLSPAQRDVLRLAPGLSKAVKNKLAKEKASFSVAEVAGMITALAECLPDHDEQRQVGILLACDHLMERLKEGISEMAIAKSGKRKTPHREKTATGKLYQFKITLLGIEPAIWRRFQVQDCTLDKLHEHIQTSMGWTNSHLHQFEIDGEWYGDPDLLDDGFDDFDCIDSTTTMLSEILPPSGKRFTFRYEYDFGDGWDHEVLFEGCPPPEKGATYPLCLEGERSCPPEDVGGTGGYAEYLEAMANPKHEEHHEFMQWRGPFDPEEFDPKKATRAMKKGLPDWRMM